MTHRLDMGSYDGVEGRTSLCFNVPFPHSAGFEKSLCLLPNGFSIVVVGRCDLGVWPCADDAEGAVEKERYHNGLKEDAETNALASILNEAIQMKSHL